MSGTIRLCYDSTDPNAIPASADLVLQYLDGANRPVVDAWTAAAAGRFANARKVGIVVLASTNAGTILDVETGDALPWQAPDWVLMRRAAGVDPTVYVNLSNWGPTRTEFQLRGIPEPHWLVADYDNDPTIPTGAIGKQYANAPLTGGNFDLSSIAPVWPGVDQGDDMDPTTEARLAALLDGLAGGAGQGGGADYGGYREIIFAGGQGLKPGQLLAAIQALPSAAQLAAIKAELDTLSGHSDPAVAAAVARIEAALKQA